MVNSARGEKAFMVSTPHFPSSALKDESAYRNKLESLTFLEMKLKSQRTSV